MASTEQNNDDSLDRVAGWVVAGLDHGQIVKHLRAKVDSDTTDADAARMIEEARAAIADYSAQDQDFRLGQAVQRLDQLYAQAVAQADTRTALAVQKETTRLLDLGAFR